MIAGPEDKMNREWTRIDANVVFYSRSFVSIRGCNLRILFQFLG
jgi:hypothetical protein